MSKKIQKLTKKAAKILDYYYPRDFVSEELDDDLVVNMESDFGEEDRTFLPAIKTLKKLIKLKEDKPEKFYMLRLLYPDGEVVSMKEEESSEEESEESSEEETPTLSRLMQREEALYGNRTDITKLENQLESSDDEEVDVLAFLKDLSNEPDDDIKDLLSDESNIIYTIKKEVYKFNESRNELEKIIDKAKEKDNVGILESQ